MSSMKLGSAGSRKRFSNQYVAVTEPKVGVGSFDRQE